MSSSDLERQQSHFGVTANQVEHDFAVSHILHAISPLSDKFVFYGGTALSRTHLAGLRLSEDIDLLAISARSNTAALIDLAIVRSLERHFDGVAGNPSLQDARTDTEACIYQVGNSQVKIQLIDGRDYVAWPTQQSHVSMRYDGINDVTMTTLTPDGFACAKLAAWSDPTRNAPRDLYDLWAMSDRGFITAETARLFKTHGPTGGYPREWMLPRHAPTNDEWHGSLGHQCLPEVGPDEAHEQVTAAWLEATAEAESSSGNSSSMVG